MEVTLRVCEGSPRAVAVDKTEFIIGRAGDCDLTLTSPLVSRYHCVLTIQNSRISVRDLESSNGTGLNNSLLVGEKPLNDGDTLWVGATCIEVHIHRQAPVAARLRRFFRRRAQHVPAITGENF